MNLQKFLSLIQDAITDDSSIFDGKVKSLLTFEDAGLLTRNKGLVVRLDDGSEFQVTVVQSK